ncbi:MAG: acylneuraminate cytidylyltransferase family protein [Bacteroidia bacterium]|nr:acylneuraminate cytidylyltransferase family protein [Bacteroidia bacterium]
MIVAFVPVRCGSKGIPLKNIKSFCGKPLLYWVCKALQETPKVDEVVVATDCDEIIDVTKSFDFSKLKIYKRQAENAQDESSTESVMIEYIGQSFIQNNDTFILVQATSPFTKATHFSEAIDQFNNSEIDSLLSVTPNHQFLWNSKGQSLNYDYRNRQRRQEFEKQFAENGAFYINSVGGILLSQNRLVGKIGLYVMPKYTALELDDEEDWRIGEAFFTMFQ